MYKKFNHLNIPDQWQHYWTRYPQGFTVLESLIEWVGQVDNMVDYFNKTDEFIREFIKEYDDNMLGKVEDTLRDWQASGFLDVVIDQALQTQIDRVETEVKGDMSALRTETSQLLSEMSESVDTRIQQANDNTQDTLDIFSDELSKTATYTDVGRVVIDKDSLSVSQTGKVSTKNKTKPVNPPNNFRWKQNPLINKIYTDGYGNFTLKDFNIRNYKPVGTTYYVDVNTGSNSNDGLTMVTPMKSIKDAYEKPDATVIKVAEGFYNRDNGLTGVVMNKDIAIMAHPGHEVILANVLKPNWQPDSRPNVHTFSSSNATFFLDSKYRNDNGDYVRYKKVSSANEVKNTPGSYAHIDSDVYLRTLDDREPTEDTIWRFIKYNHVRLEGGHTLYLEGLKIFGGDNVLLVEGTGAGQGAYVYAKDCTFSHNNRDDRDVVHTLGARLSIFENCTASNGLKDGFNYYAGFGIEPRAIEINCVARNNGTDKDGADQGSTMHNGGKVIRINSLYHSNYGSNIADIHEDTQAWMLGCIGYNSLAPTNSQNANFFSYVDTDLYLDSCMGYDSDADIAGSGTIFVRNNNLLSDTDIMSDTSVISY